MGVKHKKQKNKNKTRDFLQTGVWTDARGELRLFQKESNASFELITTSNGVCENGRSKLIKEGKVA